MSLNVECPVCKKIWTVKQGTPDIVCDCYLYCPRGTKPADCSVTTVAWQGETGWPRGLHAASDEHDERPAHNYYCSTHDYYYDKVPVLVEVDWSEVNRRAKSTLRDFGEGTF